MFYFDTGIHHGQTFFFVQIKFRRLLAFSVKRCFCCFHTALPEFIELTGELTSSSNIISKTSCLLLNPIV